MQAKFSYADKHVQIYLKFQSISNLNVLTDIFLYFLLVQGKYLLLFWIDLEKKYRLHLSGKYVTQILFI